jgi:hypothetical protein
MFKDAIANSHHDHDYHYYVWHRVGCHEHRCQCLIKASEERSDSETELVVENLQVFAKSVQNFTDWRHIKVKIDGRSDNLPKNLVVKQACCSEGAE